MATSKISRIDRLYLDESGINIIGRTKLWYSITVGLIVVSFLAIAIRGFNLSLDFEGGTNMNMPAADLSVEQVEDTFVEATGVTPELVQIVGSGDSATLEINSERLSEEQITKARQAIYEKFQPLDAEGEPSPDAIGSSTVSESWGSAITNRMLIAMLVFLVVATAYVAVRLQRSMALAALIALIVDGVVIAGLYALFGFEVSPAVIIGLLTVLTFSIYDTVIVFDKVNENTEGILGQRRHTYAEQANLAVNQTIMRSISTSVISALPIIALLVIAVWLLGVGTLRDLALIQFIGVVEGIFSSLFLAAPLLVTIVGRRKDIQRHNAEVAAFRAGRGAGADTAAETAAGEGAGVLADAAAASAAGSRTVASPVMPTAASGDAANAADAADAAGVRPAGEGEGFSGATWRPGV